MAEKKTTKKQPSAATTPTREELLVQLTQKQADLLDAKRSNAAGELVNPRVITATRKEIARLQTAIRAAEQAAEKESN